MTICVFRYKPKSTQNDPINLSAFLIYIDYIVHMSVADVIYIEYERERIYTNVEPIISQRTRDKTGEIVPVWTANLW